MSPSPSFSRIGSKLGGPSGILELMDDLGRAFTEDPEMRMMGGGNPASIPAVGAVWRRRMEEILADGDAYERMLVNYDPPAGNPRFREALAGMLSTNYGWDVTARNIAIAPGGQSVFFCLFNLLAGTMAEGSACTRRRILLPLVPEYIGYANQGIEEDIFVACRPMIEIADEAAGPEGRSDPRGNRDFKYRVDFGRVADRLGKGDIGAVCVSRPTNPTGNVLTDEEVARLSALCRDHGVPLVIDNAYGAPFPGILFTGAEPMWAEHHVLTLSLSKLGLPGTRTGIVIAREEIVEAIAAMTSVIGLANGNIGQAIVRPLLESGEILTLSRNVIRPFYEEKAMAARRWLTEALGEDVPCRLHRSEGALFLWLWFPDFPIDSAEFYRRLKARKVLVVPGHYFSFGLEEAEPWRHAAECIRVTISQPESVVREGLAIIAEEAGRAYREAGSGRSR